MQCWTGVSHFACGWLDWRFIKLYKTHQSPQVSGPPSLAGPDFCWVLPLFGVKTVEDESQFSLNEKLIRNQGPTRRNGSHPCPHLKQIWDWVDEANSDKGPDEAQIPESGRDSVQAIHIGRGSNSSSLFYYFGCFPIMSPVSALIIHGSPIFGIQSHG